MLLVDDDAGVRAILSEQLRDLGLDVLVANDAQHAIALLEQQPDGAEFVLTDLTMPGLDGAGLLSEVRSRWPHIKGAIMTGNPQQDHVRFDPGVPMLHKPISQTELKRLLAEA